MFEYISGFIFGLIFGLISGIIIGVSSPYVYNIYKNYKKTGIKSKAILEEAFLVCSSQVFDSIYDSEIKIPDLPELIDLSIKILSISDEYNKSYKLIFKNNNIVVNIMDKNILNNKQFIDILQFFKQNSMELILYCD